MVHLCSRLHNLGGRDGRQSNREGDNGRVPVPQRKKSVFVKGGKNMTTHSESTATTRSIWKLDPNHTLVEFSGKHMMFTTVKGHFKNVNGTIVLDEADPSRSSVEVEIDASTLYSGVG